MASDQRDNYENGDDRYYDSFPFKSYDEILAARRRASLRRKGYFIFALAAVLIIGAGMFIGVFGGDLLMRRMMNSMADGAPPSRESAGTTDSSKASSDGFSLDIREAEASRPSLITTYDVSDVVAKAQKSVVGILSESYSSFSANDSGSGIIMSGDGYIVTNNHVISDGGSITVVLADGTNCPAYLVGTDDQTDIAVLKIPGDSLAAAEFGDSSALTIGEPAIAIGNPGGIQLQGTVTAGIISATDRRLNVGNNVMTLIQTDASINPGNSGGPLLNKYGQVVGVTSIKITASGYEGLGFAIPINTVKPIVEELVKNGYVSGRPLVGVSVRIVSPLAATFYGLPRGLLVDNVAPDSAVAAAGLQPGDIITHVGSAAVRSVSDACSVRNTYKAGDVISLSFYRSGTVYDIEFELDEQQGAAGGYDF